MKSDFLIAITQLAAERNLSQEVVLQAVEAALVSAFKKDHLAESDLIVRFGQLGEIHVYARMTVVEEVTTPDVEMTVAQATGRKPASKIGDVLEIEVNPSNAGRIAAQTAKQVVMQRLREAERDLIYAEYAGKEGHVLGGIVQRLEGRSVIVDLGRAEALLPPPEQSPTERYRNGLRLKVLVLEVGKTAKGPQVVVSRTHKDLLRRLFELEVPEIYSGVVEIRSIAREPGFRSKVAVSATQDRVDPVGSCVGLRGMRIQNIVNELHGEKIDVVEWVADSGAFIAKALGPAQVLNVFLRKADGIATVIVPDRHLSLAIGREGQNARLAAKLTNWRIDIKSSTEAEGDRERLEAEKAVQDQEEREVRTRQPVGAAVGAALRPAAQTAAAAIAAAPAMAPPSSGTVHPATPPVAEPPARVASPPQPTEAPATLEPLGATDTNQTTLVPESIPELAEQQGQIQEEATDAVPLAEALASDATWQVVAPPSRSPIRFAEDIAEFRGRRGTGRRGERDDAGNQRRRGGGRR